MARRRPSGRQGGRTGRKDREGGQGGCLIVGGLESPKIPIRIIKIIIIIIKMIIMDE